MAKLVDPQVASPGAEAPYRMSARGGKSSGNKCLRHWAKSPLDALSPRRNREAHPGSATVPRVPTGSSSPPSVFRSEQLKSPKCSTLFYRRSRFDPSLLDPESPFEIDERNRPHPAKHAP